MLLDTWDEFNEHDPENAIIVSAHTYWNGTQEERKEAYRYIFDKVLKGKRFLLYLVKDPLRVPGIVRNRLTSGQWRNWKSMRSDGWYGRGVYFKMETVTTRLDTT